MDRSVPCPRHGLLVVALLATTFLPMAPAGVSRAQEPGAADPHADHGTTALSPSVPAGADVSPLLGNLGNHQHAITTRSQLAQRYFDEGLNLVYGFNHAEAIRSFRDAAT